MIRKDNTGLCGRFFFVIRKQEQFKKQIMRRNFKTSKRIGEQLRVQHGELSTIGTFFDDE